MSIENATCTFRHHLLLVIRQGKQIRGHRILDLATDFPPLTKEIGFRIVAIDPASSGHPWNLDVQLITLEDKKAYLKIDAHLLSGSGNTRPIISICIPMANVAWSVSSLVKQLNIEGDYHLEAAVLDQEDQLVTQWYSTDSGPQDFELTCSPDACLQVPNEIPTIPGTSSRQVVSGARNSWLRCVFARSAFEAFLTQAEAESQRERSWVGTGQVFQGSTVKHAYATIEELIELPGEAAQCWMTTRGRDFNRIWKDHGHHLTAFLHLHPRQVDGQSITPSPSNNDAVVAWDFSLAVPAPCIFPIALFGSRIHDFARDIDVFGYNSGVLSPIHWEVFE